MISHTEIAQQSVIEMDVVTNNNIQNISPSPPSFNQSQYDTLLVFRQQNRPSRGGGIKYTSRPTRFSNLNDDWEFAGWGSTSIVRLDPVTDIGQMDIVMEERSLGCFIASGVAGNAVLGSVFYAFPAVVAVCGVYAPIALFISSILLVLWKPIMEELASAFPVDGVNYAYLLNVSSKSMAIFAAALTLLDSVVIPLVSAGTASNYLTGEIPLGEAGIPFPQYALVAMIMLFFLSLSLAGVRDSSRMAFLILCFHILTMVVLMTAGVTEWIRKGNSQLISNWSTQSHESAALKGEKIFKGICISFLGLTGFECVPSNMSNVKINAYPIVLRNIMISVILLNGPLMLLVLAVVPYDRVLADGNVLSIMASICAGKWLRMLVVVDAMMVLCAAIFTGILSGSALIIKLTEDRVLPSFVSKRFPVSRAPYLAIGAFMLLNAIIYATARANLSVLSQIFSMTFLASMTLFPVSCLLMKFHRGRLPRSPIACLSRVIMTSILSIILIAGNVWISPLALGYFAIYLISIFLVFLVAQRKIQLLHYVHWAYDQLTILHNIPWTKDWDRMMIETIRRKRKSPVVILIKTDEIDQLFKMVDYVHRNEETSSVKLIHFCGDGMDAVPSELDANSKIIDEAFPQITIDLIFVLAHFTPTNVLRLSKKLAIPPSQIFMSCPGKAAPGHFKDYGGVRIVAL